MGFQAGRVTDRLASWRIGAVEAERVDLPVLADVDVVVVGAGAAGVAAATVAAEAGLSVVLVEKYGFAGGAAVAGMSGTICGMYLASERRTRPEQVVAGFTERFRKALADRGGLTPPQIYGKTWTVAHDPLRWREVADEVLTRAGVRILFHSAVVAVLLDGDRHRGVVVESNAGQVAIHADRTIDASGDGAVAARAGLDYWFGDNGNLQNPTMFFRLGNVDTSRFWKSWGEDTICSDTVSAQITNAREDGIDLPRQKIWAFATPRHGELLVNATRISAADGHGLNVIDPEDFTEAEVLGRRQVRSYAEFFTSRIPGCEDAFVVDTGVEAGIRQTRSVAGTLTLHNEDVVSLRKWDEGICRSPWPIELHAGERPTLHWILDDFYEIPYRALVPKRGENIIVAGRCLSAEHEALASCRVTAQCFEYGHAAAIATVLSLQNKQDYRHVSGTTVRFNMVTNGSAL